MNIIQHLGQIWPSRYREIPEATDPAKVLLRQFALVKRHVYLQQFVNGENPNYYHSHPWRWGTIAIGLRGSLTDVSFGGYWPKRRFWAPYLRYMGPNHVHRTERPSADHLSIFIGLGTKTDQKGYWVDPGPPKHWSDHIKKQVERI